MSCIDSLSNVTVSSSWTQYYKKDLEILHWALPPVCLPIVSSHTVHMTKFPRPSLSTPSNQKLEAGQVWERGYCQNTLVHLHPCLIIPVGCREPTPPSRGSINNFPSAAEGATITYSCSPGLVPRSQIRAVCINMTWRPDPATLQCRESGEYCL